MATLTDNLQLAAIIVFSFGVRSRPKISKGCGHPSNKAKTPAQTKRTPIVKGDMMTDQLMIPASNRM